MEGKASASRRELTKTQNRETILAAARQVFAELGFAAATVRDIIRATPLASGTLQLFQVQGRSVSGAARRAGAAPEAPSARGPPCRHNGAGVLPGELCRLLCVCGGKP